jgi:thiol:disulfide interchange protein
MAKIISMCAMLLITTLSFAQIAPNYETALAMSAKEKKPIMITIVTSYCPWCHKLKNETFKDPAVAKTMQERFITLILNKDSDKIPQGLSAKVVPTTFFINSKGAKISQSAIGFFEAKDFSDFLTDAINNSNKL